MRKLLVLVMAFGLWGCGNEAINVPILHDDEGAIVQEANLTDQAKFEKVKTNSKGEMCGGIAGLICGAGLECQISTEHSDASGICVESVEQKDLICPKERKPVCGIKNGAKNGYMNECEAIRHGAEVVSEGFCKVDETVMGNCVADFTTIGNCAADLSGFVFVEAKGTCTKKYAKGCEAEIPFESLEACQTACVK